ncbi:MAG: putative Ig domain-containing protein, partial [Zoogloeaceae bacterium]|nr:putative Ig domain-containing protein [Zoogloeaceae bacterium]
VLPESLFIDPEGDALIYTVTQSNGSALPDWLAFDTATCIFSGMPNHPKANAKRISVQDSCMMLGQRRMIAGNDACVKLTA